MIRVYTASKLTAASMWRELAKEWRDVHFHARWLRHVELGTPDDGDNARMFWVEDEEDVNSADAVLVYGREGEHLKGALVEAGMAIASGIPVIVVGEHADYGTWQYHPGVYRVPSLEMARDLLTEMNAEKMELPTWVRKAAA